MSVDALAAEVRRATTLIAFCRKRLLKAESDVKRSPENEAADPLGAQPCAAAPPATPCRVGGAGRGPFLRGARPRMPVCGARRRRFLPYGYVAPRADALCPSCLSLERHRLLWLYLTRETDLLRRPQRILHIAPEVCLMKRLRHRAADYTTADLESRWPNCISTCCKSLFPMPPTTC